LKIESITLGSRHFVSICCHRTQIHKSELSTGSENRYRKGETKFKGGDLVIKKLLYQAEAQPEKKYTVCYEDRFLGLVESDI